MSVSPSEISDKSLQKQIALLEEKNSDLAKRIRTLSEESRSQQHLIRTLFDFTPFGLIMLDEERRVIQVNKAGRELLRKDQLSLIGKTCDKVFSCYSESNQCTLIETGSDIYNQETLCHACHCDQTFLRSAVITKTDNKALIIEAFIDISKIKQADRVKNDFLTKMSHELRTPLNAISGFTELLLDELPTDASEESGSYLNILKDASKDLEHLIDELLDVANIRGNSIQLDIQTINVAELILQMEQEVRKNFSQSERLTVNIDSDVDTVYADPKRLKQILVHLLTNAFKYGNNSPVQLDVSLDAGGVLFMVSDQGQGITEEQQQRVFNEFEQGDNSITRQFGGVGLGLSIAQHFTRMMGSELKLQSQLGEGTQVSFLLDVKEP